MSMLLLLLAVVIALWKQQTMRHDSDSDYDSDRRNGNVHGQEAAAAVDPAAVALVAPSFAVAASDIIHAILA